MLRTYTLPYQRINLSGMLPSLGRGVRGARTPENNHAPLFPVFQDLLQPHASHNPGDGNGERNRGHVSGRSEGCVGANKAVLGREKEGAGTIEVVVTEGRACSARYSSDWFASRPWSKVDAAGTTSKDGSQTNLYHFFRIVNVILDIDEHRHRDAVLRSGREQPLLQGLTHSSSSPNIATAGTPVITVPTAVAAKREARAEYILPSGPK
jgi:hypothetical protein